ASNGAMSPRYQVRMRGPMSGASRSSSPVSTRSRETARSESTMAAAITIAAAAAVPGRHSAGTPTVPDPTTLALDLAAEEALDLPLRQVVGELSGRMLHQVGRHAQEWSADAAIAGYAAAPDGIDDAAGGVGTVLHRQPELELDGRVAEASSLD